MFPPIQTGTAFYTKNLAHALSERGHKVTIATLGDTYSQEILPAPDGVPNVEVNRLAAYQLPMKNFFKHFRICTVYPSNWWRLFKIARNSNTDVILLVNHYLDIAMPTVVAAKFAKVPLLCSVGTQLQSLNPRRDKILNLLDRAICGTLVFPFCKRIIAWDNQIKAYLSDVQGKRVTDKTVIVNYGVNGDTNKLTQKQHNYQSLRSVVLGVGAVSEQRSFVPLVRAFSHLAKEFPKLRLRIIGHVYYKKAEETALELGISDRIDFLGEKSHDDVLKEMGDADVFYSSLTGKYVGLGTATIEAMASGVPAVVNAPLDLFGEQQLVDGMHFVQSPDDDPLRIADRIKRLIVDAKLRATVGTGGRAFVQSHLNWEKVAKDMETVLQDALSDKSG